MIDPHQKNMVKLCEPDWTSIRQLFPSLTNMTYLNTAGGCAMPKPVAEAGMQYFQESVNEGDACWTKWLERTEVVRSKLAETLGVGSGDLAFLGNASLGMNYALKMVGNDKGVLLVANDFPSVTLPWVGSSPHATFLPTQSDGSVSIESISQAINEKIDVVAISHVQYNSGYRFDLAQLSALCRERGVALVVDATQSCGASAIDLRKTPVDVLICSGYKWLLAGYGIGIIYVSPEVRSRCPAPFIGWRSAEVPYKMLYDTVTLSGSAKDLELGHPPFSAIFALGAAIDLINQIGISHIEQRIRELTLYLHKKATEVGITIASTRQPTHISGITMLRLENPDAVVSNLKARGIFVSVRNGLVRVSVHFYNTENDIDTLISSLSAN
jgi:cysteine desulfurase/selenocysteine lyase